VGSGPFHGFRTEKGSGAGPFGSLDGLAGKPLRDKAKDDLGFSPQAEKGSGAVPLLSLPASDKLRP
jgi:hypothetical protein